MNTYTLNRTLIRVSMCFAISWSMLPFNGHAAEPPQVKQKSSPPAGYTSADPAPSPATYARDVAALMVAAPPLTTEGVSDLVPETWIAAAVSQEARKRWSQFAMGAPIPCSDESGKLVCWQVPVLPQAASFPAVVAPPPADQVTTESLRSKELWGIGEYWTFVVSARSQVYPVPVYGEGLPPLLVTVHRAQELAQSQLEGTATLTQYAYMGRRGVFYIFRNAENGKELTLEAHSLRVVPSLGSLSGTVIPGGIVLDEQTKADKASQRAEYLKQCADAWAEVQKEAEKDPAR